MSNEKKDIKVRGKSFVRSENGGLKQKHYSLEHDCFIEDYDDTPYDDTPVEVYKDSDGVVKRKIAKQ